MIIGGNSHRCNLNLDGEVIDMTSSVKYLGVFIDNKLSFKNQVKSLKDNINDRVNMMKILLAPKVGCHPQSAINIYKGIIENYLNYGSSITANAPKSTLELLNAPLNACKRKISGCTRSTPLNTLSAITGICPFKINFEFITKKEIARQFCPTSNFYI